MIVEGHSVPAGTYSLLAIPNPDRWTIIFNTDTSLWGHYGYQPDKDFPVPDVMSVLRRRANEVDRDRVNTWWERFRAQDGPSP